MPFALRTHASVVQLVAEHPSDHQWSNNHDIDD